MPDNSPTREPMLLQPVPPPVQRTRSSKLDAFEEAITALLEQDPQASAVVIVQRLRSQGYHSGITILKEYLRELRTIAARKKAYVRLESPPGDRLEIDWVTSVPWTTRATSASSTPSPWSSATAA